jgi:hypothetical protein
LAVIYDSRKVEPLEEIGGVTVPARELDYVKLPGVKREFRGFDRNPYLVSMRAGELRFALADVHVYFGEEGEEAGMERRCLEALRGGALGRPAAARQGGLHGRRLALGDFNPPVAARTDPVYRALTRRGLHLPPHSTKVGGSNLSDDAQYDQMAVFPGPVEEAIEKRGVFDFDGALFRDLWGESERQQKRFRSYVKYYISDHRPLWAPLTVG